MQLASSLLLGASWIDFSGIIPSNPVACLGGAR